MQAGAQLKLIDHLDIKTINDDEKLINARMQAVMIARSPSFFETEYFLVSDKGPVKMPTPAGTALVSEQLRLPGKFTIHVWLFHWRGDLDALTTRAIIVLGPSMRF